MASLMSLVGAAIVAMALSVACGKVNRVPIPAVDLNAWWGPGQPVADDDTSINPFKIEFTDAMINDLKARLQNHRPYAKPLEGSKFEYGFNGDTLELWREMLLNNYPFKDREAFLNQYNHFKTKIQGLNVHFMRVTAKNTTNLTPLLIVHGHRGSIREFYECMPHFMEIGESNGINFDIIMPSIPGFIFSDPAAKTGCGVHEVAVIFRNLMHRLGYKQYYIQGGDMGALITNNMATLFQDEVLGYHTNFPLLHTPDMIFRLFLGQLHKDEIAPPEYQSRIYPSWDKFTSYVGYTGYLHFQATRPDTFGLGLTDSPLGLMSHILYTEGTPNNTGLVPAIQLLDNYVLTWATNCVTTTMRLYSETFNKRYVNLRINEIVSCVLAWVLQAPTELVYLPEFLIRLKYPNLLGSTMPPHGGHFFGWQYPKEYAQDVVTAIVAFKQWHAMNNATYSNCLKDKFY